MVLSVNAAVVAAGALVLWVFAARRGDPSFVDVAWGAGFVAVAGTTLLLTDGGGRRIALAVLTAVWGTRLAGYLYWRWRRSPEDPRYRAMMRGKPHPARWMLTNVFALQAALLYVVSLPVQLGQVYSEDAPFGPVAVVGVVVVIVGIAFESTADWQLVRFKATRENTDTVLDTGVWRYSRHPNYFGDFCVWWGLFLVSVTSTPTAVGVVGPIVMSVLLMRVSGVGPLEKQLHRTKPKYADYVARTSAFFPRPPRG